MADDRELAAVEQCDRDAAADWMRENDGLNWGAARRVHVRDGSFDDNTLVQAFARHRLNTRPPADPDNEGLVWASLNLDEAHLPLARAIADELCAERPDFDPKTDADDCSAWFYARNGAWLALATAPRATEADPARAEERGCWSKNAAGVKDGASCYRTIGGRRWQWWAEDAALFRAAKVRHRRAPDGQGAFIHPDDEAKAEATIRARTTLSDGASNVDRG